MELRHAEAERDHERAPGGRSDLVEMHHAQNGREHCAGDDAKQHGDVGEEAGAPFDQAENEQQHEQRDAEPLQLSVGRIGKAAGDAVDHLRQRRQAAAGPVDADPHQGDADDENDAAGDDGREQRQQPADERRRDDAEQAGGDH